MTPPQERKPDEVSFNKTSASTPPPSNGIHIEKPISEAIFRPPKISLCKCIINPNANAAQYYNIVEDLAQEPCAM